MLSSAISMSLNLSSATAKGFVTFDEDMQYVVEKYESKSDDFYRTEMDGAWTFNPGMLFGYKGVSYYSSTMNGNSYEFFKNQGISVYALNVSTVYFTDFLKDSLFGIKYIYARGEGSIPILYNEIEKHGYITVYENPYNLGVAFLVDDDVLSYKSTDYLKSDATSKFFKLASGENDNILSFIKYDLRSNTNSSFYIQNGNTYFSCPDTTKPAKFTYTFNIYDTDDYNLNFNFRVGNYEIYVNDNLVNTGTITGKGENIGSLNEGDKVRIEVSITGYSIALEGVSLVKINYDALNSTFNKLKSGTLNVTYSSNTKIEGTINVSEKSTLLSSIPAENGWNVYVDGIKKEIIKFDNTLIAISIEPGEHTIEYKYNTPGLKLGIIISSISFISISLYYFLDLKKRRTL